MSPGYKTTEFYVSLFVMILGAFVASGIVGPDHISMKAVALITTVLAALGYTLARAKTKFGDSLATAEAMKMLPTKKARK